MSFDFCRQWLTTGCVLSLLQDLPTEVQDFFPSRSKQMCGLCYAAIRRRPLVARLNAACPRAGMIMLEWFLIAGRVPTRINKEQRRKGYMSEQNPDFYLAKVALVAQPTQNQLRAYSAVTGTWASLRRCGGHRRHVSRRRQHRIGGAADPKRIAGLQCDNWRLGVPYRSGRPWRPIPCRL